MPIYTCSRSNNSPVLRDILSLYVPLPGIVADITWGQGAFWADVPHTNFQFVTAEFPYTFGETHLVSGDPDRYDVLCSDLYTILPGVDGRNLPYRDLTVDAVVIDPPYAGTGGQGKGEAKPSACKTITGFGNKELGSRSVDKIIDLYLELILEAYRILDGKGVLILKCQDQIEASHQRLVHVDLINELHYHPLDGDPLWEVENIFVVQAVKDPMMRHPYQVHARTNHSYFIVARKKTPK